MITIDAATFPTRVITDIQDNTLLFWSNVRGWVEQEADATLFTLDQVRTFTLPIGECVDWTLPSNWGLGWRAI